MDGGLIEPAAVPLPQRRENPKEARLWRGMPALSPRQMPEQAVARRANISRTPLNNSAANKLFWRRVLVLGGAAALTIGAIAQMSSVLAIGGLTPIEIVLLVFFSINFCWIALTFATAFAGFVVRRMRRAAPADDVPITGRTAVALPAYNEDPSRIFAAIETMANGVARSGVGEKFDWFILSDTTDFDVALKEQAAFAELRRRMAGVAAVYYRRRLRNVARKPGNIADFCRRWGGAYDYLLVLDADSLMEPATIIELARRMDRDPSAGIVQTVPSLVGGRTLFARLQQFAGRVYGQIGAAGLAWWTGTEGNYWGHNAIIRMAAFTEAAGLPVLSGKPPFGGHILSHDFVEAALIRRAGWSVLIADDLGGSYEEGPPSIADVATRDRRWCQGNLQHGRLVSAKGFHWVSRMHLLTGIMSYAASPLWLGLILAGLMLAVQAHLTRPDYFPDDFHLFPTWPVIDAAEALRLFGVTMFVLFIVKVLGFFDFAMSSRGRRPGIGTSKIAGSVVLEVILSALLAPILMLIQTGLVFSILTGRDAGWHPQRRTAEATSWRRLAGVHRWHLACGLLLISAGYFDSPRLLYWLAPAIVGLVLVVPVASASASERCGEFLRRRGLLITPEEQVEPAVMREMRSLTPLYAEVVEQAPGLNRIIADERLRSDYLALIEGGAAERPRGEIDAIEAVTVAKIAEARSLSEALSWLKREEQAVVISAPHILERLAQLPAA